MHSFGRLLITRNSLIGIGMNTRSQSKQTGSAGSYVLTHDTSSQKFRMKINSSVATVNYKRHGDVLDLIHSHVPDSLRGKGIGQVLAKSTFDYIDQNKLQMKVTCTFLRKVYEENKNKYEHLINE